MKIVKYPATTVILKLFCDCGKGELIYQSSSENGHLHKCNNTECGAEFHLSQTFPSTRSEILNVLVDEVRIKKEEAPVEAVDLTKDVQSIQE